MRRRMIRGGVDMLIEEGAFTMCNQFELERGEIDRRQMELADRPIQNADEARFQFLPQIAEIPQHLRDPHVPIDLAVAETGRCELVLPSVGINEQPLDQRLTQELLDRPVWRRLLQGFKACCHVRRSCTVGKSDGFYRKAAGATIWKTLQ